MLVSKAHERSYGYNQLPAIKIARLATDRSCQDHGCGEYLIHYSIAIAMQIKRFIGCRLLVTDALPEKINWYKNRGFILSMTSKGPTKRENYPMYQILPVVKIEEKRSLIKRILRK
jgi:N-acetylglutamate synthase-like GNAT family acetyltransferase